MGGGGRTAKIPEIAFTLKSSHFRVGQIAEGFEIFNPAFGAHGLGGGLGKIGSIKELRVKAQTNLVAACYQERAPGTPRPVPTSCPAPFLFLSQTRQQHTPFSCGRPRTFPGTTLHTRLSLCVSTQNRPAPSLLISALLVTSFSGLPLLFVLPPDRLRDPELWPVNQGSLGSAGDRRVNWLGSSG